MKNTRLLGLFCGIMLTMTVLFGCVTNPDGGYSPDYATIELGSVVAMTVVVNEVKSSQAVKDVTYARLAALHDTLSCSDTPERVCPPYNLQVLPLLVANALPTEYQALGPAIITYIESRARMYYDLNVPESENTEMVRKISVVVIGGALQALAPHISK